MKKTENPLKSAVLGHPVGHSLSPMIHQYWLQKYNINGSYQAYDVLPENLHNDLRRFIDDGYRGFNITLPHKISVMDFCDVLDEVAQKIGAVNTIWIDDDEKVHGNNTDAFGFIENIRDLFPDFDFTAGPVLVLGSGGAARGVVHGLLSAGVPHIRIVNRTDKKSVALAEEFDHVEALSWDVRHAAMEDIMMLVNTTSGGMTGQDNLDISLKSLNNNALVYDIVYKPLQTKLLQEAAARGNLVLDGLGMLLHQARPAFQLWTGVMPDITDDLRRDLEQVLEI